MSKSNSNTNSKETKKENPKEFRPKNMGPSGFPLYEYLGAGKDHSQFWIKFKKSLKSVILQQSLDVLLEKIIDEGVVPTIPEIDKYELYKEAPAKFVKGKVSDKVASSEEQVEVEEIDQKSSKSKGKKSLVVEESKEPSTDVENPFYEMDMVVFLNKVKTISSARENRVIKLTVDLEKFYVIMWLQCGIAMQSFLRNMKSFTEKNSKKDTLWLFRALESVGTGTAAIIDCDSQTNTLMNLTGLQMNKFTEIHSHLERWKQTYLAFVTAGNQVLPENVQIEMFIRSLHDGYNDYKADVHNRKVKKQDLPETLDACVWEASQFVSITVPTNPEQRAVFLTADQHAHQKQQRKKPKSGTAESKSGAPKGKGKTGAKDKRKDADYLKDKECYGCRKLGHLIADCPEIDRASDTGEESKKKADEVKPKGNHCRMVAWTSSTPNQFLLALDNCAYSSVICNETFASNLVKGQCPPLLNWNGESHTNDASGFLHPFGYCEVNKQAPINLLSEFEVRSRFHIEDRYEDDTVIANPISKVVFVGNTEIEFKLDTVTRQYVVDWRPYHDRFTYSPKPHSVNVVISSVKQNEAMFSKDEVRRAKLARDLIAKSGYASKEDMMRLVSSQGNIVNIEVTRADIQRAIDIYGSQHVLHGRSRIMRPDTRVLRIEPVPKRAQELYCDKFCVAGLWFMLCSVKPLGLLLVLYLEGASETHLAKAFIEFVAILQSYKYETSVIYSDADPSAIANINKHSRVRIEACAAGDHVDEAETQIKTVKERFRSVKAGVLFTLTKRLVVELVQYIVGRINIGISQYSVDGLCPRVRLTETMLDANKELRIGFGYLVVARNKNVVSNDAMELRGEVCLTLRPVGNRQGSWRMMKLTNGRIVARSQFKEVPMTDLALARLAELAVHENAGHPICLEADEDYEDPSDVSNDENFDNGDLRDVVFDFPVTKSIETSEEGSGEVSLPLNSEMSSEDTLGDTSVPNVKVDEIPEAHPESNAPETSQPLYSTKTQISESGSAAYVTTAADRDARAAKRVANSVNLIAGRRMSPKKRFHKRDTYVRAGNFNISHVAGVKKYGSKRSLKAQYKEIKGLCDNGTFEGVLPKDLTGSRKKKIIRTFMLLNEKFNAEGDFEKLKARLVANGAQMDPSSHTDLSAPTVSLTFLLMMVAVAARERREVATMDVGSAFVKASMDGEEEVLVALDQLSAAILIKIDPSFKKFLNEKNEMVVKLKKALYGCLQSARLWFQLLVEELQAYGYVQNAVDPCVLNREVDGKQSTLLLHVDDIMVLSQIAGESKELFAYLEKKFGTVAFHEGVKHNYLGMTFDFSILGQVYISMVGYEADLVKDWFAVDIDSQLLPIVRNLQVRRQSIHFLIRARVPCWVLPMRRFSILMLCVWLILPSV